MFSTELPNPEFSFKALGDDGNTYVIDCFVTMNHKPRPDDIHYKEPSDIKTLRTEDGQLVTKISKGKYTIPMPLPSRGLITLRSADPKAP